MLSLNNIVIQISFQQTLEKFIFSTQKESTEKMAKYLAGKNYYIKDLYLISDNKLKKITTKQFVTYFKFSTELLENLNINDF